MQETQAKSRYLQNRVRSMKKQGSQLGSSIFVEHLSCIRKIKSRKNQLVKNGDNLN